MQRFLYHLILLSLIAACNSPKPEAMNTSSPGYTFLVGTYTDNASQGINLVEFIPEQQSLTAETIFEGVNNPSFLLANRSENLVISLEEDASISGGNLMVFGLAGKTLTPIEAQTGPAIRNDESTIEKHLDALDNPNYRELYQKITLSIQNVKKL